MSYSDDNAFEKVLERMLAHELFEDKDKRVGSIIYDALAPIALEISNLYAMMDILAEQTYTSTATGTSLDARADDFGLTRKEATKARCVGSFLKYLKGADGEYEKDEAGLKITVPCDVPVGARFVSADGNLKYEYLGKIDGDDVLECEDAGAEGGNYEGRILPLTPVDELASAAIVAISKYGEDRETDDELKARLVSKITSVAFGGNISDYIEEVTAIDGVGNVKVFPAWQGGGTVLVSVVSPSYDPVSEEFIGSVKELLDPKVGEGEGVGIAPIGHRVTVTTPARKEIAVSFDIEMEVDVQYSTKRSEIESFIKAYFDGVRQEFSQNKNLVIYRARLVEAILKCPEVVNVSNMKLDGKESDIVMEDFASEGGQFLPYVSTISAGA